MATAGRPLRYDAGRIICGLRLCCGTSLAPANRCGGRQVHRLSEALCDLAQVMDRVDRTIAWLNRCPPLGQRLGVPQPKRLGVVACSCPQRSGSAQDHYGLPLHGRERFDGVGQCHRAAEFAGGRRRPSGGWRLSPASVLYLSCRKSGRYRLNAQLSWCRPSALGAKISRLRFQIHIL